MFCFPLTNWTTMRGASTVSSITQSETMWLDLRGFEDIVAWLDVRLVTPGTGGSVSMVYQTAPTKDDALFTAVATVSALSSTTVTVTKALMSSASVPLSRWLRWQLTNSASTSWDATFRIWIAANIGPHPLRPRIQAPPTRQSGKSCNGDCSKGGSRPINAPPPRVPMGSSPASLTGQQPATNPRATAASPISGPSRYIPPNSTIVN
jgi:hypothetical protein